jgi:SAM-dependent methyltransferase
MKSKGQKIPGLNRQYTYDGKVAQWWLERSADAAHKYAYKTIADFLRSSFAVEPRLIIDYACGAGPLLSLLSRRFEQSRLVGLDGSAFLLKEAERRFSKLPRRCRQRIRLVQALLPDPDLLKNRAGLVLFCFPNMMPRSPAQGRAAASVLSPGDRTVAATLARIAAEEGCKKEGQSPSGIRRRLEYGRAVSLNLRHLLVRGGICVRVEYAASRRHEWSKAELQQVCFEEGTLDAGVDGIRLQRWFHVLASAFFRSHVFEDVYQQTGDMQDRGGGYLLTVLRAL